MDGERPEIIIILLVLKIVQVDHLTRRAALDTERELVLDDNVCVGVGVIFMLVV